MGGCFSSRSSSTFNNILVVHLNGYVEYFDYPVSVSQVTGTPPKHFVCTPAQLLSTSSKPLKADAQLQLGQIYFMLPFSTLQADVSQLDLVTLARKLNAIAKTSRCKANSSGTSPSSSKHGSSPVSPARSPSRFMKESFVTLGGQRSCKAQSWKPFLDTIREKSFNQRSESDLQEMK
ncbi:DUF4228 domain-containing protein [Quillaja saponaria]|uniref:DUF4228 domain-containing protein n=1 Tax=Quillaja saponaria TaxID=32244 RepID=A0AAD7VL28_QUISA|nr:DUF4228 domain-containing protein [Quillaja saponaria]